MRKLLVIVFALATLPVLSQTTKTDKYNLVDRASDHIMFQLSSDHWTGAPDSISSHIKGPSRGANIYIMLDKPFKGNPKFSFAFGLGVGTSHIFFKKMMLNIASVNPILPFKAVDTTSYFKKYKLATSFLEVPLELRFTSNPGNAKKGIKAAIGIKGGIMLNAHTKGKILKNSANAVVSNYTEKILSKSYFNTSRLALTGRFGYGIFSVYGAYNITSLFKDGVAADMKLFQIGITLSGL